MPEQKQTKALTKDQVFSRGLQAMHPEFSKILPSHIPADKFIRVVETAGRLNPNLASSDQRVLYGELMKCANDGLLPDGNEATIQAYGNKPKYMPMVAGICKRARNSGLIKIIDAIVVYENDFYEAWTDETGPHFKHKRAKGDRGEVVLTFAYAITTDGGFFLEEIDEKQMASIEKSSKASTGPWKGPFKDEMRRKSAIRRLAKYRLPSSADMDNIIRRDDDMFNLDRKPKQEKKEEGPSRLKNIIDVDEVNEENTSTTLNEPKEEEPPI